MAAAAAAGSLYSRRRAQAASKKVSMTEMTTSSSMLWSEVERPSIAVASFAGKELFDPIGLRNGSAKAKSSDRETKHGRHVLLAALRPQSAWEAQSVNTQRQRAGEVLVAAAAGFAGASLGASSMLAGRTNARAASAGRQSSVAMQAVGIGINGFGRIG